MSIKKSALTGLAASMFCGAAYATSIDFESVAIGTYNVLNFADLSITYTGGNGNFQVVDASPGAPISGHSLISYFDNPGAAPFLVTFNGSANVTDFSIGVGDYNADEDNTYLEAFDANWNSLGSDYYYNPAPTMGGDYLSVASSSPIKYVKFWDADPYAGAVYWDNLSYNASPVPLPAAAWLFGSALAGMGLIGKVRSRQRSA